MLSSIVEKTCGGSAIFELSHILSVRRTSLRQMGSGILAMVMSFAVTVGVAQTASETATEAWVARYDNGAGTALAVDAAGNVYVTGESDGYYATVKYDRAGNELWVERYQGPDNDNTGDRATALALDAARNVHVTGTSYGGGDTDNDYATIKYDSDNSDEGPVWVRRYDGSSGPDNATALFVDTDGNVYVTGTSYGGEDTDDDYATIKYDSDNSDEGPVWVRRYDGSSGPDNATALFVDTDGNVYVTGTSYGGEDTDDDYATIKYERDDSDNGEAQEDRVVRYNGPGNGKDNAAALTVDAAGNVYVTGSSYGGEDTGEDYATVKYDNEGNLRWVARYDGPGNGRDNATALAVDDAGNVYVTGSSADDIEADETSYATIKYDSRGRERWVRRYNGSRRDLDSATALTLDTTGNVYVTGSSDGDYATIKYDRTGEQRWIARHGGGGANALAVDRADNVYVTGESQGIYTTIKYVQQPSVADGGPRPEVRANGSRQPLTIAQGDPLIVTISLDAGSHAEQKEAEWWVAGLAPFGVYWYIPGQGWVFSGGQIIPSASFFLINLPPFEVLNTSNSSEPLPVGAYTFLMGVDLEMNGTLDLDSLYYDFVTVDIE